MDKKTYVTGGMFPAIPAMPVSPLMRDSEYRADAIAPRVMPFIPQPTPSRAGIWPGTKHSVTVTGLDVSLSGGHSGIISTAKLIAQGPEVVASLLDTCPERVELYTEKMIRSLCSRFIVNEEAFIGALRRLKTGGPL